MALSAAYRNHIKAMSDVDLLTLARLCRLSSDAADLEVCKAVKREQKRRANQPEKAA